MVRGSLRLRICPVGRRARSVRAADEEFEGHRHRVGVGGEGARADLASDVDDLAGEADLRGLARNVGDGSAQVGELDGRPWGTAACEHGSGGAAEARCHLGGVEAGGPADGEDRLVEDLTGTDPGDDGIGEGRVFDRLAEGGAPIPSGICRQGSARTRRTRSRDRRR